MPTDQELIDAVLAGDEARFNELFDRYHRRLFGLIWHACGDRELAEDLGQEAFLRAFQKLNLYAGQSQFFTWLARIAMNLLSSYRRKRRFESEVEREGFEMAIDSVGEFQSPEANFEQTEMQQCVRKALAMLDEERRVVLVLRDFEDMDYDSIAKVLDIPIGTVRSRIHRARIELKTIFQTKAAQLGIAGQS